MIRARVSWVLVVTRTTEFQRNCLAIRPRALASPWVVAGFGSKQMSFTPGTGDGHGPPYPWFPRERAFVTTASPVRIAIYSEAAETDFQISSLDIYRLTPAAGQGAGL